MKKLDSKETLKTHKDIILGNVFLKNVYINFYKRLTQVKTAKGLKVEIGSGSGFLKKYIKSLITSDVINGEGIDKVFFAEKMPLKKSTVSAFYMLNTLHHIKDVEKALTEMNRCLVNGGKIIMIETWNTPWSSFIYKNFHHEPFDPSAKWRIVGKGRLSDSNQALPWIVFVRDKKKFEKLFPTLTIEKIEVHSPFLYLLSGGLSHKPFVPTSLFPVLLKVEKLLSPLNKHIGMFATIVIKKNSKSVINSR